MKSKGIIFRKDGLPEIHDGSMINEDYEDLFDIKEKLRSGIYGSVSLAETLDEQTKVVVKFINFSKLQYEFEKE